MKKILFLEFDAVHDERLRSRFINEIANNPKQLISPRLPQQGRTVFHCKNTLNKNLRIAVAHRSGIYVQQKANDVSPNIKIQ